MIDGYNIMHHLWRCDWSHGGQFDKYKDDVKGFYEGLLEGSVKPIVVLDGITHVGPKWSTYIARRQQKIQIVHKKLHKNETVKDKVFPSLGAEVYVNVLEELKLEYIVVDHEADDSIVGIANFYECPVLSSDSDFYLFNIKGGYVRFDKINFSTSDKSIKADVYYYQHFCDQFNFSDESVRLIIPVLVGNDFWSGFRSIVNTWEHGLLPYIHFARSFDSLQSFSRDRSAHLKHLGKGKKNMLKEACQGSSKIYDTDEVFSITDKLEVTKLHASNKDPLPQWVLTNYRKGRFPKASVCML